MERTLQKVENVLIQSRIFTMPKSNPKFSEANDLIVQVTESQIERQKNQVNSIAVKRRNIR